MKKTLRMIGLAAVAILIGLGVSSCGSDDDDDNINPSEFTGNDPALVGTWVKTETGSGWSDTETYTFNADGTYSETEVEISDRGTETSFESGTWKTNSLKTQVLLVKTASNDPTEVGEKDIENYSVSNGVLTLDRDVYTIVAAN